MALAKEQLATQTPQYEKLASPQQVPVPLPTKPEEDDDLPDDWPGPDWGEQVQPMQYEEQEGATSELIATPESAPLPGENDDLPPVGMPPNWPDSRGFIPPPPRVAPPSSKPSVRPVISHTQIYHSNDMEFTEALASYYYFRDEPRFGGWQAYLQRSSDFVRFCCHMHISETLSARGGVGETRVVWRWPTIR